MRAIVTLFILGTVLLTSQAVLADPPDITYDVPVVANATPAQCTSSWRGDASPASGIDISRFGSDSVEGPGVVSCTGCAIDNSSGDCVCHTCYSYYDGD